MTSTSVTSTTVTNTSTTGPGCDDFTCIAQCAAMSQLGQCVGGMCECMDLMQGAGGGFGFGGAFP